MKLYALIGEDTSVVGVAKLDDIQFKIVSSIFAQVIDVTDVQLQPQIGWLFDGQNIQNTSRSKKITRLAMRQRLTVQEMLGILTYTNQNPASIVSMLMQNLRDATFVDLSRSDTQAGLGVLVQLGLLTSERMTAILSAPVTPYEAYKE